MDMEKTTQKVKEALQQAQVKALRYGHQEVDAEHVLFALLEQEGGLVPRLVERRSPLMAPARTLLATSIRRSSLRRAASSSNNGSLVGIGLVP